MANYYAQNASSANINAAGVWYDAPSGGNAVTLTQNANGFTGFWGVNGDTAAVLIANGKSITINVSTRAATLRNDAFSGATGGGTFTLNGGLTLTANCISGPANLIALATVSNVTTTINGDLTANGTGATVFWPPGSASATYVLNYNGNLTATFQGFCISINSTMTLNVTGNIITSGATPLNLTNSQTNCTITGNHIVTGLGQYLSMFSASGLLGTINITGNVQGPYGLGSSSIATASSGYAINLYGTATGGRMNGAGISNSGNTVYVVRAKGGEEISAGPGVLNTSTGVTTVREIEYGTNGASPTVGAIRFEDSTANVAVMHRFGQTKKALTDPASTATLPAISDVRSGTTYGSAGSLTGTMAVPSASQVFSGVAVDNTTGTAQVTTAVVQAACDAALTAFSSGRLGNVATVASTGQQIASALTK